MYIVAKASQGLANYLVANSDAPSVAIGYDSRIKSDVFAKVAASVFAANGVQSISGQSFFRCQPCHLPQDLGTLQVS